MNLSTRILKFERRFKKIIEEQHKDRNIPRTFQYEVVRKMQLNNLEEREKEEEVLTLFHENIICKDYARNIYSCGLLEKAKLKRI